MNDERREQIRGMLLAIVDNMKAPDDYPDPENFKRDWLNALVDVAQEEIKKLH
jgi:hypothetical protein